MYHLFFPQINPCLPRRTAIKRLNHDAPFFFWEVRVIFPSTVSHGDVGRQLRALLLLSMCGAPAKTTYSQRPKVGSNRIPVIGGGFFRAQSRNP